MRRETNSSAATVYDVFCAAASPLFILANHQTERGKRKSRGKEILKSGRWRLQERIVGLNEVQSAILATRLKSVKDARYSNSSIAALGKVGPSIVVSTDGRTKHRPPLATAAGGWSTVRDHATAAAAAAAAAAQRTAHFSR
jgi:hypothetical protein